MAALKRIERTAQNSSSVIFSPASSRSSRPKIRARQDPRFCAFCRKIFSKLRAKISTHSRDPLRVWRRLARRAATEAFTADQHFETAAPHLPFAHHAAAAQARQAEIAEPVVVVIGGPGGSHLVSRDSDFEQRVERLRFEVFRPRAGAARSSGVSRRVEDASRRESSVMVSRARSTARAPSAPEPRGSAAAISQPRGRRARSSCSSPRRPGRLEAVLEEAARDPALALFTLALDHGEQLFHTERRHRGSVAKASRARLIFARNNPERI